MTLVAGVLVTTIPGAAPRVATRLLGVPGLEIEGGDGDARLAAVCTAESGEALERLVERLVAGDEEILGIYPTFVGQD
jgi:nitrate reductase NapAB chaperone NapD